MDFLKEILGEELFSQFKEKVDAFNGDEANKDKQIKLANLTSGEYVGKGKFEALQQAIAGKDTELTNANTLIADLKKAAKNDEGTQKRIADYEAENKRLQEELTATKVKSALKVSLLAEKAVDVDYLIYKLTETSKEKGETLELDENDNIKGWDDKLSGLKVQFPSMFEVAGNGGKKFEEQKLEKGKDHSLTKSDILKMSYAERNRLAVENPEAYSAAMQ